MAWSWILKTLRESSEFSKAAKFIFSKINLLFIFSKIKDHIQKPAALQSGSKERSENKILKFYLQ